MTSLLEQMKMKRRTPEVADARQLPLDMSETALVEALQPVSVVTTDDDLESAIDEDDSAVITSMTRTAIVFLETPLARRLAVAWTTGVDSDEEWLEAAGILPAEQTDALRICMALRRNNICHDDGTTDQLALNYIAAVVLAPLQKQQTPNPKRGKSGR